VTELSILIPVLDRPANVHGVIRSIVASDIGVDYRVVFISSVGRHAEHFAIDAQRGRLDVDVRHLTMAPATVGDYARKINFAAASFDSTWYFLGADDIHFHPGWFANAIAESERSRCFVVGTQDLGNSRVLRGEHSTHSLVHQAYIEHWGTIDQPGKVLHEGYPHEFVDDEFVETAKSRNQFCFAQDAVVEHLHPMWGKAPWDEVYEGQRRRMNIGRRIYTKRRRLWTSR
jgi:hypothetical protein